MMMFLIGKTTLKKATSLTTFLLVMSSLQQQRPVIAQDTSCPSNYNLTEFNAPKPPQTATILDLDFTCVYSDFQPTNTYQFVPSPFIRIEPGDTIAFYSTPPDIYDIIDQVGDGTTVSLAHNPMTVEPNHTFLVITWPSDQLQKLRSSAINATILLADGFTALEEINITTQFGGFEAYLSSATKLKLDGENRDGIYIVQTSEDETMVDIEIGNGNIEINAPSNTISGRVHAVRNELNTGNVYLNGVQNIQSTGEGPGNLYTNDCNNVEGRNCLLLSDDFTFETPNVDCRLTDICLVTVETRVNPTRICSAWFPEDNFDSCGSGTSTNGFSASTTMNPIGSGLSGVLVNFLIILVMLLVSFY